MNDVQIYYDPDDGMFGSCSTLTPLTGNEIQALVLNDGMFGEDVTETDLADYLNDDADELWAEVCSTIL